MKQFADLRKAENMNIALLTSNIQKINEFYDAGNTIIYWTARGTGTGIDWREVTEKQFEKWGSNIMSLSLANLSMIYS